MIAVIAVIVQAVQEPLLGQPQFRGREVLGSHPVGVFGIVVVAVVLADVGHVDAPPLAEVVQARHWQNILQPVGLPHAHLAPATE